MSSKSPQVIFVGQQVTITKKLDRCATREGYSFFNETVFFTKAALFGLGRIGLRGAEFLWDAVGRYLHGRGAPAGGCKTRDGRRVNPHKSQRSNPKSDSIQCTTSRVAMRMASSCLTAAKCGSASSQDAPLSCAFYGKRQLDHRKLLLPSARSRLVKPKLLHPSATSDIPSSNGDENFSILGNLCV